MTVCKASRFIEVRTATRRQISGSMYLISMRRIAMASAGESVIRLVRLDVCPILPPATTFGSQLPDGYLRLPDARLIWILVCLPGNIARLFWRCLFEGHEAVEGRRAAKGVNERID